MTRPAPFIPASSTNCSKLQGRASFLTCMFSPFSRVELFVSPWTVARQPLLSMGILPRSILEWVAMPSSRRSLLTMYSNSALQREATQNGTFYPYQNHNCARARGMEKAMASWTVLGLASPLAPSLLMARDLTCYQARTLPMH